MPNMAGEAGFGARDTVKGMVPGRTCIVKILVLEVFQIEVFPVEVLPGENRPVEVCFIQSSQSGA